MKKGKGPIEEILMSAETKTSLGGNSLQANKSTKSLDQKAVIELVNSLFIIQSSSVSYLNSDFNHENREVLHALRDLVKATRTLAHASRLLERPKEDKPHDGIPRTNDGYIKM